MNARRLVLPAVIAGLFFSGYTNPAEDPKPDNPPQAPAPPPRAKGDKTKADMLVGKWNLVARTIPTPDGYKSTVEYTADGKVTIWTDNPSIRQPDPEDPQVKSGTYRVEEDKLIYTFETPGKPLEITKTIISITKDKLTTSVRPPDGSPGDPVIGEYERVSQRL